MTIAALIDKQDTVEIVRDQIGAILVHEIKNQMTLAATGLRDPADWELRIFSERSNPWEQFLEETGNDSPIVNVWWDSSTFDPKASNVMERQKSTTIYNVDCYGYGASKGSIAGGHIAGDQSAAFEVHKAIRLVRNILMAAEYTYLDLRGTVYGRWPQAITVFQPQQDGMQVQQVVGARLAFRVEFNEFSPQVPLETLELLSADVHRTEDGQLVLEADYDYS